MSRIERHVRNIETILREDMYRLVAVDQSGHGVTIYFERIDSGNEETAEISVITCDGRNSAALKFGMGRWDDVFYACERAIRGGHAIVYRDPTVNEFYSGMNKPSLMKEIRSLYDVLYNWQRPTPPIPPSL